MAPRKPVPAPSQCKGTAKHSGERCKRWAVPGALVCKHHGAYAGGLGRAHTEDLHEVRRIEAVVTDAVNRQMAGDGWAPALLEEVTENPPRIPTPHRPPAELFAEQVMDRAMAATVSKLADNMVRRFKQDFSGHLTEDIARLEARPTPKRSAEAARLRQIQERPAEVLTLNSHAGSDVEPSPRTAPEVPQTQSQQRKHRITTSLGIQAGDLR